MTFEEIQILLKGGIDKLPEPSLREDWKKVFERMVVHSRGVPPLRLFDKTFPNEDHDIKEYREENYEPITTGSFDKGFDNLYRALSESNWSLNAPDDLKKKLKELTINKISFWQYLFKIALRRKIEDPNGLLVILPNGDGVRTNTKQVGIRIELVLSTQITYWTENVVIFKSTEKSAILVKQSDNKYLTLNEGEVFYALTDTDYFKYYQTGKKEERTYITEEFYKHDIGDKPMIVLGGRPTGKIDTDSGQEQFYFNSDFHAFVAHANEALIDKSIHQGVKVTSAYPIRVMDEMPCDNKAEGCMNGVIYNEDGTVARKCPRCKGTGNIIPTSVYKGIVLQKKKKAPFTDGANSNQKPFEYIYPSVDILKHMGEESDNALSKAERALQTVFIEAAQSGTAKEMDREDQYSMLYSFSDYWFDIVVKKTVQIIYRLLNPTGKDEISIIKPVNFKIKDEASLLQEFTDALKNEVPQGILIDLYMDWIKKRFSGDALRLKMEEIAIMYDPFYVYPLEKKNELKMTSVMTTNDFIKSVRITGILTAIYKEKQDQFFKMTDEQFIQEIDKRVQPFLISEQPPKLPNFGADPNNP